MLRSILPVALFTLCACAYCAGAPTSREIDAPIKSGDLIEISIFDLYTRNAETVCTRRIDAEGKIHLPIGLSLAAKGRGCRELETAITKAYRDANIVDNARVHVKILK